MAVVDYVEGDGDPPPELEAFWHTRDFGSPRGGGWEEWDPVMLREMVMVRNVYNAWLAYKRADNPAQWLSKNPSGAEIVGLVKGYKYEAAPELTHMERWERIAGDDAARQQWERLTSR